jgi:alkanesulfonate monooxygenase SsuD/methylene tetrahydromethanopterin reductase-like flavin-dependent oxidoreductase (luciferase family)
MSGRLEAGLQLHLPSYRDVSLQHLLDLSQRSRSAGIDQLWVTDNLQSRNTFVVLTAIASRVPVRLGTAVIVQYFRSPLDLADAVGAIAELMDGRELSLGISRGNPNTPGLVRSVKPVTFLRETAVSLRRLLDCETVQFRDYPVVAEYFNLQPEREFRLNFQPGDSVKLYCGGNAPLSLKVGGQTMAGIVFGWTFLAAARAGRLAPLLQTFTESGGSAAAPKIAEIKLYVDRDDARARESCRRATAGRILGLFQRGYTDEEYARLGIPRADIERLFAAVRDGVNGAALAELVTDPMIDALFVAGDPARCREQLQEVSAVARAHGFTQIMFSELAHDVDAGIQLLCDEILPSMG